MLILHEFKEPRHQGKEQTRKKIEENVNIHSHLNHWYMTQEEILKKLDMQKCARLQQEEINRERDMLQMSDDDHKDLLELFNQASMKDIPAEMAILWEQQEKILSINSSNRYRWHPRYISVLVYVYEMDLAPNQQYGGGSFHIGCSNGF